MQRLAEVEAQMRWGPVPERGMPGEAENNRLPMAVPKGIGLAANRMEKVAEEEVVVAPLP